MRIALGFAIGCLALAPRSSAQPLRAGPQVATFLSVIDDTDQPYGLYIPKNFDAKKKYPLVIMLHGAGSNHRLDLKRVFGKGNRPGETDAEATRYWPEMRDVDYIVAAPLARGTMGYQGIAEADVLAVLDDVRKRFLIDEDRTYLTGLSMGGGGTLWLGLTRPDLWAAIAPVCPAPPIGTQEFAPNALNLPVKVFQGDADPLVKVEDTRAWHKRFLDLGVNTEYVEYPGVKHNSWDNAYANGAIFDWFSKHKRNSRPERVRFVSDSYGHASAYWVTFDSLTPGTLASIDARITGKNSLEITSKNLEGFTLALAGKWTVALDGKKFSTSKLSFARDEKGWREGKADPGPKKIASMAEVLGQRHIYVYGTADDPPPDELARRRDEAQRLAEWGTPRWPLLLTLRTLADHDVKDSDLANGVNLVLLGSASTNSFIARYASTLPLALRRDAADYALAFVAPADGRNVIVMSGKPVSTAPRPFAPNPMNSDFVVMRGSDTIASGHFDKNWQPTAALPNVVEVHR